MNEPIILPAHCPASHPHPCRPRHLHPWNVTPQEARNIQIDLATHVVRHSAVAEVRRVAGVDVAVGRVGQTGRAGVVVLGYPELAPVEVQNVEAQITFPYIPGLLSFRELPAVIRAFERLAHCPDLVMVDGQGLAHPRRFGIACHLGVVLDLPTIGCAKSILLGRHDPLGDEVGATGLLVDAGEVVGAAVRTRVGSKPLYVSIGHKVDLDTAVQWVLACCRGHRLPEPTRLAHLAAAGHLSPLPKGEGSP
ncbi:MAG: deoxyribonuclease V [Chloroflexi bacterium]|nr:deoxyribonuclease V [Chloroflexota bacterium]